MYFWLAFWTSSEMQKFLMEIPWVWIGRLKMRLYLINKMRNSKILVLGALICNWQLLKMKSKYSISKWNTYNCSLPCSSYHCLVVVFMEVWGNIWKFGVREVSLCNSLFLHISPNFHNFFLCNRIFRSNTYGTFTKFRSSLCNTPLFNDLFPPLIQACFPVVDRTWCS